MNENVRAYLNTIKDGKRIYGSHILDLCQLEGRKVAFHSTCTDGIVSASLMRSLSEGQIFVPLDYWILRQQPIRRYLSQLEWYGILDLEPFNDQNADLYVDHHMSTVGRKINAKKIHLEVGLGGKSAASIVAKLDFPNKKIPDFIVELINISEITDTASYKTQAPVTSVDKIKILANFDEKIWFLEDSCKSCRTVQQNIQMVEILSERGLTGLFINSIIKRVNYHRKKRKYYSNYADNLMTKDLVFLINPPDTTAQDTIVHKLLSKADTKVICSLIETQSGVKISFRKSKLLKNIDEKLYNNIRLDKLAELMEGGGHPAAAGARSSSVQKAIKFVTTWAKKYNFEIETINVKAELRSFK